MGMKYIIEFELPDNETVLKEIKTDKVNWSIWGYSGQAKAKPILKEQEAVEPTFKQGEDGIFVWACGSCGAYMYHIYDGIDKAKEYAKYCRQCGKKVKWE